MNSIYTMGIDVGSTTSKCVIIKNGTEVFAKALVAAGTGTSGPGRAMNEILKSSGLLREEISYILATGYGRITAKEADSNMSELSCHAKGAEFLFPGVRTVIDIGGQDAKVLSVNNGLLTSFKMNDKCAAGTGRFLDVMARVLEVDINTLGDLSAKSQHEVQISSTCTVFAESEVISQLSNGSDICDIVRGIHVSVASKAAALARREGLKNPMAMTGGVAKNKGVVKALSENLGCDIFVSTLSQFNGAIGAALYGYEKISNV